VDNRAIADGQVPADLTPIIDAGRVIARMSAPAKSDSCRVARLQ
jgi:hypothetical protein